MQERKRLLLVAVVPRRVNRMGYKVADPSVLHSLFEAIVQVLQDLRSNRLNRGPSIVGQVS